jgi:ribosomal protein S18 acetylase RimI-like enzyme
MVTLDLAARPASRQDQHSVASLIYFEPYVHRHLDWGTPTDWIESPYCWVIEKNGRINAALACPPDPESIVWIRLFASVNLSDLKEHWNSLWENARRELQAEGIRQALAISTQDWFSPLLCNSGFQLLDRLVMLDRSRQPQPNVRALEAGLTLRPMTEADLPSIAEVDTLAFDPIWHNSIDSLRKAFPQSMFSTVIENESGKLIGYQISTRNAIGAHLARLAVIPSMQGKGLGAALVGGLIDQLERADIRRISVNTQSRNQASLALYHKMGFERTFETYPIYACNL